MRVRYSSYLLARGGYNHVGSTGTCVSAKRGRGIAGSCRSGDVGCHENAFPAAEGSSWNIPLDEIVRFFFPRASCVCQELSISPPESVENSGSGMKGGTYTLRYTVWSQRKGIAYRCRNSYRQRTLREGLGGRGKDTKHSVSCVVGLSACAESVAGERQGMNYSKNRLVQMRVIVWLMFCARFVNPTLYGSGGGVTRLDQSSL